MKKQSVNIKLPIKVFNSIKEEGIVNGKSVEEHIQDILTEKYKRKESSDD